MSQIFQRIARPIGSFIFHCGKNLLNGTEGKAVISRVRVNHRSGRFRIFRMGSRRRGYHRVRIVRPAGIIECLCMRILPLIRDTAGCSPRMRHLPVRDALS
jgi:hypothetical protein